MFAIRHNSDSSPSKPFFRLIPLFNLFLRISINLIYTIVCIPFRCSNISRSLLDRPPPLTPVPPLGFTPLASHLLLQSVLGVEAYRCQGPYNANFSYRSIQSVDGTPGMVESLPLQTLQSLRTTPALLVKCPRMRRTWTVTVLPICCRAEIAYFFAPCIITFHRTGVASWCPGSQIAWGDIRIVYVSDTRRRDIGGYSRETGTWRSSSIENGNGRVSAQRGKAVGCPAPAAFDMSSGHTHTLRIRTYATVLYELRTEDEEQY